MTHNSNTRYKISQESVSVYGYILGCVPQISDICFLIDAVWEYEVEIHTGDEPGADTDANVYIQIYGERGDYFRQDALNKYKC